MGADDEHRVDVIGRERVRVVFEGDPPTPRFLQRATDANNDGPATLAQWEERQAGKAARDAQLAEQDGGGWRCESTACHVVDHG